jgi:hypothetical protein
MQLEIIKNNYVLVPGFITSNEARILAFEFQEYCKKFNSKDATDPSLHVGSALNWLMFIRLLVQKIPEVSSIVGEPVLPTYTYARWQTTGHELSRHRDRPSCEISLSVNLKKDKDWDIWIQKPNGEEVNINLNPGDAILYLGCQANHWRNKFEGNEHVQLFLHYVRADGPKAWAFFDKQQQQEPTPPITNLPITII